MAIFCLELKRESKKSVDETVGHLRDDPKDIECKAHPIKAVVLQE